MSRVIKISKCTECPSFSREGASALPPHKPCCLSHPRLELPYEISTNGHTLVTGVIPEGCPLPKEDEKNDEDFIKTLLLLDGSYDEEQVREFLKKNHSTSRFMSGITEWESDLLDKYLLWKGHVGYQLTDADKAFIKEHGDTHGTATEADLIQTIKAIHNDTAGQISYIVDAYLLWGKALSYGKS